MASKLFQAIGFRVDIEVVSHPDGRVIIFHIPTRPLGTAYSYEGTYYMRIGEELKPMSEDKLRMIFSEGKPSWLDTPVQMDLTGQDVVQLLDTQTYFDLLDLPYPSDRRGVLGRLEAERLISKNDTGYSISNLAAVLLAKELKNFPAIARKAPRVIVYDGIGKMKTKGDVSGGKGYAVGFQGLVQHVDGAATAE